MRVARRRRVRWPRRNTSTSSALAPARCKHQRREPAVARCDAQRRGAAEPQRPRRIAAGIAERARGQHAQALAVQRGVGAGARRHRAHAPRERVRTPVPVEPRVAGAELGRERRARIVLRRPDDAIGGDEIERGGDGVGGELRQTVGEIAGRFAGADRRAQDHGARTCVHLALDAHHRDAGLGIACEDRVGDRRGAAMARQDAGVGVDQAVRGAAARECVWAGTARTRRRCRDRRRSRAASRRNRARRRCSGRSTGIPLLRRARSATGDGDIFCPRPRGRSGCVTTATTRCGPATRRASVGTANSGVPKKSSRSAFRASSRSGPAGARRDSSSARLPPGAASCACRRRGCASGARCGR